MTPFNAFSETPSIARARNRNPGAWERFEKAERERIAKRDAQREDTPASEIGEAA